ncbi:hypothetical protein GOALK_118_00210 [Gordonia alkanivorans NBRC 16433]|uniref:Uncharacterized protein n=1 Tax=Gordonia alkanivorans NBRC 16433 TaxID=1027371 RepID=F9W243_9ACTN|nr:hypothetical protein GOALK_118_00210 [Gordonia alkanivorans NBRC 16433]
MIWMMASARPGRMITGRSREVGIRADARAELIPNTAAKLRARRVSSGISTVVPSLRSVFPCDPES